MYNKALAEVMTVVSLVLDIRAGDTVHQQRRDSNSV